MLHAGIPSSMKATVVEAVASPAPVRETGGAGSGYIGTCHAPSSSRMLEPFGPSVTTTIFGPKARRPSMSFFTSLFDRLEDLLRLFFIAEEYRGHCIHIFQLFGTEFYLERPWLEDEFRLWMIFHVRGDFVMEIFRGLGDRREIQILRRFGECWEVIVVVLMFDEDRALGAIHQHVVIVRLLAGFRRHIFIGDALCAQGLEAVRPVLIVSDPRDECGR